MLSVQSWSLLCPALCQAEALATDLSAALPQHRDALALQHDWHLCYVLLWILSASYGAVSCLHKLLRQSMSGSNSATCRSWGAGRSRSQPTLQPCWCASELGQSSCYAWCACQQVAGQWSNGHAACPCPMPVHTRPLSGRDSPCSKHDHFWQSSASGWSADCCRMLCCREGMQRCLQSTRRGLCRSGW